VYKAIQKFKNQQQQQNKKRQLKAKRLKIAEYILWGISVVSLFYAFHKLDDTFVPRRPVVSIWVLSGLVVSAFLIKDMKAFWGGVFFSGAISVAILLLLNNVFCDKQERIFKVSIRHKYYDGPKRRAHVEVEFGETDRGVNAINDKQVDTSSYIILTLNRGYLGYYIIRSARFVKD
jgi:hypothetical protein